MHKHLHEEGRDAWRVLYPAQSPKSTAHFPSCTREALERRVFHATQRIPLAPETIRCFPDLQDDPSGEYLSLEHLVAVHVTNTFPREGMIKTTHTHLREQGSSPTLPRHTVHFSLNHPVASHAEGNWDAKAYAILIPLEDLVRLGPRFLSFNPVDTFIFGDLKLPPSARIYVMPHAIKEAKRFITEPPRRWDEIGRVGGVPVKPLDTRLDTPYLKLKELEAYGTTPPLFFECEEEAWCFTGKTWEGEVTYKTIALSHGAPREIRRETYDASLTLTPPSIDPLHEKNGKRKRFFHKKCKLWGSVFRHAVYNAIVAEGYFPMKGTSHSWLGMNDTPYSGKVHLAAFLEKYHLPFTIHATHWTGRVEELYRWGGLGGLLKHPTSTLQWTERWYDMLEERLPRVISRIFSKPSREDPDFPFKQQVLASLYRDIHTALSTYAASPSMRNEHAHRLLHGLARIREELVRRGVTSILPLPARLHPHAYGWGSDGM